MAQPQHHMPQMAQIPPASFSPPPQHSPSPGSGQQNFAIPPSKRPRTSPGPPSQPASPYLPSPHCGSPGAILSPSNAASPGYSNLAPQGPPPYASPYNANGNQTAANLHLPESRPMLTPTHAVPVPLGAPNTPGAVTPNHPYTTATMAPIIPAPTPGTMGPPSKPADKPQKEYEYDVSDSLAGTGIDLRQEELALADYYASSFAPEARMGLPANAAGSRASVYGAGWVNQPGQPTNAQTQDQLAAQAADSAWAEAALRLANMRKNEMDSPFLSMAIVHRRADKIAKEHGIGLNMDLKNPQPSLNKAQLPVEFPQPKIVVKGQTAPDGYIIHTSGSWIPNDAYLVDQLALLSIAAKHRLREKLEDADTIAMNRQQTAHGEVPAEWIDAAAPLNLAGAGTTADGPESAANSQTNPLKRSFDSFITAGSSFDSKAEKNLLAQAVRDGGKADRDLEEARLLRRQKRQNPDAAQSSSRAVSAAPGTPGLAAPEPDVKPAKKETKKSLQQRSQEVSTASANQTLSTLMGGFGGRKKGKQYSWMTSGASGTSTPKASSQDAGTTPATPGQRAAEKTRLTVEGRYRLGTWREDGEKGKHIQLRDWVTVLEMEGMESRAIQDAYTKLDASIPK